MLIEHQHPDNKTIMVSVLGVPNAGKSTLINYLLGMDLSVVTHKAQTTRNKFNCILTVDRTEIVLVDTPGVHKSNKEFNKRLNQQARESVEGADLNLIVIDISKPFFEQVETLLASVDMKLGPTWIVFNKMDKIKDPSALPLDECIEKAKELVPTIEKYFVVSASKGDNVHLLTGEICDKAEPGPHFYDGEVVSNKNERFFVTEYIREQAFLLLQEELPYEVAVLIEEYKDLDPKENSGELVAEIGASIIVNRPSQRGIVVGSKGTMIKSIGTNARAKIEAMLGGKVHLNLHVKVMPNWHKNNHVLEEIGLPRAHNSTRVWHKR